MQVLLPGRSPIVLPFVIIKLAAEHRSINSLPYLLLILSVLSRGFKLISEAFSSNPSKSCSCKLDVLEFRSPRSIICPTLLYLAKSTVKSSNNVFFFHVNIGEFSGAKYRQPRITSLSKPKKFLSNLHQIMSELLLCSFEIPFARLCLNRRTTPPEFLLALFLSFRSFKRESLDIIRKGCLRSRS